MDGVGLVGQGPDEEHPFDWLTAPLFGREAHGFST